MSYFFIEVFSRVFFEVFSRVFFEIFSHVFCEIFSHVFFDIFSHVFFETWINTVELVNPLINAIYNTILGECDKLFLLGLYEEVSQSVPGWGQMWGCEQNGLVLDVYHGAAASPVALRQDDSLSEAVQVAH